MYIRVCLSASLSLSLSLMTPSELGLEEEDERELGPSDRGDTNPQECPENLGDKEDTVMGLSGIKRSSQLDC